VANSYFTRENQCSEYRILCGWLQAVASIDSTGIFTLQTLPHPMLSIKSVGEDILISWIVPSMTFVLQENSDLNSNDWIDVDLEPVMTNFENQVTIHNPAGTRFYRLVSR
jgi:hypothetical protein